VGGYALEVHDLSAYAGSTVHVRFEFFSADPVVHPGWYIDDFEVVDAGRRLTFLVSTEDGDGDGSSNADELASNADPFASDTDGDEVPDAEDNCPSSVNVSQRDSDQDGAGDPCDEDRDGDGSPDIDDNCIEASN
jgi:hypothetical protein